MVDTDELGGAGVHATTSGLASLVVPDAEAALEAIADLLRYLPSHVDEPPPRYSRPTIPRIATRPSCAT